MALLDSDHDEFHQFICTLFDDQLDAVVKAVHARGMFKTEYESFKHYSTLTDCHKLYCPKGDYFQFSITFMIVHRWVIICLTFEEVMHYVNQELSKRASR